MTSIKDVVPASHHDLLDVAGTAILTTIDSAGRPQTTAVWFRVDEEGRLATSITAERQKFKNMSANPEIDFFFIDPANPFHTLEVRGTVELVKDDENHSGIAAVGERYGMPLEELLKMGSDRYNVIVTPRKVVTNG
ncbi:TIGR03618 family F420-dependent PPOX class oxidoreductase [Nocardioides sp. Kera G14]|uniref:TIGR03618 family F420-dependent PPOX class oxidoreductase n=1 Tax=Nocardioides sp. Kera G14 TaxID=2884264 RepID=UPI001D11E30C|nr:TIGR03618 family F420-dependent PPOX class oxidoreductase [Nocardioides sp. Kera G14]UDY23865.1 TIGR03618 family F420-dependent PPOX class oxidoreductase [Nocardioides sp. Kera G14]